MTCRLPAANSPPRPDLGRLKQGPEHGQSRQRADQTSAGRRVMPGRVAQSAQQHAARVAAAAGQDLAVAKCRASLTSSGKASPSLA